MRRLAPHRAVPVEPQPGQILQDAVGELGPAAAGVDVLDAQQEMAARGARRLAGEQGRPGVSEMQPAGRARREAGHGHVAMLYARPHRSAKRRSEEHTTELQSLITNSTDGHCLKTKTTQK